MIKVDYKTYNNIFGEQLIKTQINKCEEFKEKMLSENNMLGWTKVDTMAPSQTIIDVKNFSKEITDNANLLIVVGIGGSYLGAKAIINAFKKNINEKNVQIVFAGFDLSVEYLMQVQELMAGKKVYINVISKSGNTLETKITFNVLFEKLKVIHPKDYNKRIIVTTNNESGDLLDLANKNKFKKLVVPKDVGGRFSVLSAVGLLPICVAGIDIDELLKGYISGINNYKDAFVYALCRQKMFENSKVVEALTVYENKFADINFWLQQLFAESLGKNKSGVLPIVNCNTTNLHSIGQFLQDGNSIIFETIIDFKCKNDLKLKNYKMTLNEINNLVKSKVAIAHLKGNTPSIILNVGEFSAEKMGEFIYFCYMVATFCGYLQNVNPFDQPGVEEYKKLLNKELK